MNSSSCPVTDKNIWITGASSGIGRELALRLARAGNQVIASARKESALRQLQQQAPGRIIPLVCDVGDDRQMHSIAEELANITDTLDAVIINAGVCEYVDNLKLDTGLFRRVFAVNVFGAVNTLAAAIPLLRRAQKRGHIVGVGSLSTVVGLPRAEAYGASKAALQYLLESLRVDAAAEKMDVTVVRPGFVHTSMTRDNDFPMPFVMSTGQAAEIILRGVAKRQRVIEFPKRLCWSLKLAALCSGIWYRILAPKLSRVGKL